MPGTFFVLFFHLTYSRWASTLPSCLYQWSLRIFPSLPGSHLTCFYRDASSAHLQLVNRWLNFTSRFHAFRYGRRTQVLVVRIELATYELLAGVQVTY